MVETRLEPGTEKHARTQEDAPAAFTRYSQPYDMTATGVEVGAGGVAYVPIVKHASYNVNQPFTRKQEREALIKECALRILAGLENRPLGELAREIGCHHLAIHTGVMRFCERLGLRPMGAGRLRRARESQRRRLAKGVIGSSVARGHDPTGLACAPR